MTTHRIRPSFNPEGILCAECSQPVRWLPDGHYSGKWEHGEKWDAVALAASMARHPSGRGLK